MDTTTKEIQQALTDIKARLHAAEEKLERNYHLQEELDDSMRRLVGYVPVVEATRRDVRERQEDVIVELRLLALRAVGMHDILMQERVAVQEVYELDGAEVHPTTDVATSFEEAARSTVASEPAPPRSNDTPTVSDNENVEAHTGPARHDERTSTGIFSPTSIKRTSSIAERLARVHTAASHANMRRRAASEVTAAGNITSPSSTTRATSSSPATRTTRRCISSTHANIPHGRTNDESPVVEARPRAGSTSARARQQSTSARIVVKIETLKKGAKPPFYRPNGMSVY